MTRKSRALALFLMVCAVFAVGFGTARASTSMFAVLVPVRNYGPYITLGSTYDSVGAPTSNSVGGIVRIYAMKAGGTDTGKIGDVVYIDSLNQVAKSTTAALYNEAVGVIVGGRSTNMMASIASADVGTLAANPGRPVLVMRWGRAWVKNDAAAGLTAGGLLIPSATVAGAVLQKTGIIDTSYRVLGRAINGGAASAVVLAEINVK